MRKGKDINSAKVKMQENTKYNTEVCSSDKLNKL